MFCNIMNGLTNFYSSNPVCICDEIDEDDYDEMYDNTYVTDEELNEMCNREKDNDKEYDKDDEMYAIF